MKGGPAREPSRRAPISTPDIGSHIDDAPAWSPDGTSLAFAIQHWDPTGQFLDGSVIATVPVGGGDVTKLTAADTFMAAPDWSPDGRLLVMNSYDLHNIPTTERPSNLYTIKPDGSSLRQLTHSSKDGSLRIGTPRWTDDGTKIVVSVLMNDHSRIGFVDAGGGEPALITGVDAEYPDLRPAH